MAVELKSVVEQESVVLAELLLPLLELLHPINDRIQRTIGRNDRRNLK